MSLPTLLTRFLTRLNRNGPVAWTLFFAMNGVLFVPLFVNPTDPNSPGSPGFVLLFMLLGGIAGFTMKSLLVRSGKFESTPQQSSKPN